MSLFKSREWWSVNLNEAETYDSQCLLVLTLNKDDHDSVLLGSHDGFLRLFSPSSQIVDGVVSGYKPSHLLLELQLPFPILQVDEGILVSGSHDKFLAVLHPRLFSVYCIKKKESKPDSNVGDQAVLEVAYQHVLRHSAYSFILGPFGGVRGRDFICIQSLDGLLSFYEQESFAFQIYLPTFMLPHAFTYLEKIDSFLFLNGSFILDCYTYEALASAGNENQKKISKTWEYNLGEEIVGMKTVVRDGQVVVVLSERTLLGLNENGKLLFMKRLEYRPVAFCSYALEESRRLMTIIATDGQFVHLYEDTNLKWSLKIDLTPVALNRIFLNNLPGGLALLSEDGHLQCVYIGTHPSVYIVPMLPQPEINVQKAEEELKQLQQKIADNDIVDPVTADLVSAELRIDKTPKTENGVRKCLVTVEVNSQCVMSRIQVLFVVEAPLTATNPSWVVANCCEKTLLETYVYLGLSGVVSSLEIRLVVTYITTEGVARCLQQTGTLPLSLVVVDAPAAKEAQYKITITTNKTVCGVGMLFRDVMTEETTPNAIGLKYLNSEDTVTILAAKSSQRYRLQSDSLPAITLLLSAMVDRLKTHFRRESDFSLSFNASLPLETYFEVIQHHHDLVQKKKALEEKLSKETCQYRTVQKKILMNLKDVTPKPSSNLHKILKDTSDMILGSIDALQEVDGELLLSRCTTSSLSRMVVHLLELMGVGGEDLRLMRIVFSPHMHDTDDQGWIEVQEATASFLLRTALAKSTKDQQKPTDILLESKSDTSKLAKHFSSVIDRVTKGTHLLERNEFESKKEVLKTIQNNREWEESFSDEIIPRGSKYVDLKAAEEEKKDKRLSERKMADAMERNALLTVTEEEDHEIQLDKDETKEMEEQKERTEHETEIADVEAPEEKTPKPESTEVDEEDDAIWDVAIDEMQI